MDENQLIPTAQETWAGVKIVADAILARAKRKESALRISGLPQYRFGDGKEGKVYFQFPLSHF